MLAQITTDGWIAIGGIAMTVSLFVLSGVIALMGWLLKSRIEGVESRLADIPDMQQSLAVIKERQEAHGKRADRHSTVLDEHGKLISEHSQRIAMLGKECR